jgi:glycosyltransferase involved in cell wall biosynthesis
MKVLIKGMRNATHSVALVNQFNLIALGKEAGIQLVHYDHNHNYGTTPPGFNTVDANFIKSITTSNHHDIYDIELNMEPLCKKEFNSKHKFSFFVTEFGTLKNEAIAYLSKIFESKNDLIVPSNWVKNIIERNLHTSGKIHVIPHGVDANYFKPLDESTILNIRRNMGYKDDDFIFLNLGAMTWNKGIDKLLSAFDRVRKNHTRSKLILKDSANLYGIKATDIVNDLIEKGQIDSKITEFISVISQNLDFEQLNNLYNIADCYLAPYRAEGFNIPVLESMFCNTPVIVSMAGSTDDFANTSLCTKIKTTLVDSEIGFHLEPDINSLIDAMASILVKNGNATENEKIEHEIYKQNFTTNKVAKSYLMKFIEKTNRY